MAESYNRRDAPMAELSSHLAGENGPIAESYSRRDVPIAEPSSSRECPNS